MLTAALLANVDRAIDRRAALLARLEAEGTDCHRVFHGIAEGEPGLSIDRYGPLLLLQTWREPMPAASVDDLGSHVCHRLGMQPLVVANHRGAGGGPTPDHGEHTPAAAALAEHTGREAAVRFCVRARHRGADPWLFLDLRAGRRAIRRLARGASVLNLFAYTCTAGLAAAAGGAHSVVNVDFAASALEVGRRNLHLNSVAARTEFVQSDCIPVLRQLAGQPVQRPGRRRPYVRFERRPFDLIVLDPPRWAKGPFGAVDVVRDYASLFKPCLLTLADDGAVIATNHVPSVDAIEWCEALRRTAAKAGRPLRDLELLAPDPDFPTFDGNPPLKVAICRI